MGWGDPNGNVADQLAHAIMVALSNRYDWQGPPAQDQEMQWGARYLPSDQYMKLREQKHGPAQVQHGSVIPAPLRAPGAAGASAFEAFWGRPAIAGAGPFLGEGAGTVGMRAPAAAATNINPTQILDTFIRQSPDVLRKLPPDVLHRIIGGAGAASLGASTALLGSALDAGGNAGAAPNPPPQPPAPFATPRPFARQKPEMIEPEAEMIEPIASYPASTRKRKGR